MKTLTIALACAVLILAASVSADDKLWFDMEGCAFCKEIGAEKGLAEHMHHEYHHLTNGLLSITMVDEEYHDAYMRSQNAMQKVAEGMAGGEMPSMCGHCSSYGEFMMAGVSPQYVKSEVGDILVWTSDDPEMVKKLHAFGDRTVKEMAAMMDKDAPKK